MSCLNKIDWALFKAQKAALVLLTENHKITPEETLALDGVINMMDAIQDEFMPAPTVDDMQNYVVLYRDEKIMCPTDAPFGFQCWAENTDHAEEQCENAYPGCDIVWVWQGPNSTGMEAALGDYYNNGMEVPNDHRTT